MAVAVFVNAGFCIKNPVVGRRVSGLVSGGTLCGNLGIRMSMVVMPQMLFRLACFVLTNAGNGRPRPLQRHNSQEQDEDKTTHGA
jgi:hypothetical protein